MLPTVDFSFYDERQASLVSLPPGHAAEIILPRRVRQFREQTAKLDDMASFLSFLAHQVANGFQLAIFIDQPDRKFTAILDYPRDAEDITPCCNRAELTLNLDAEFKALLPKINNFITQDEFVEFVESWASIFLEASSLLKLASEFESHTVTKFKKVVNPRNGTGILTFDTEERADQTTQLPEKVTTQVSVFAGQKPQTLVFLLRYRVNKDGLFIQLALPSLESMLIQAVLTAEAQMVETLTMATKFQGHLLVHGKPPESLIVPAANANLKGHALPQNYSLTEGDHIDESVSFSDPRPTFCPPLSATSQG